MSLLPISLSTRWLGHEAREAEIVDSTNDRLWEWAREGAGHGALFVAARQSGGRGRQGRRWESPAGNLYFSVLVFPESVGADLPALSLAVGIACARTLRRCEGIEPGLKWPNDLLVGGRKLGGILLETRRLPHPAVVIGIGINLVDPEGGWGELEDRAVSLEGLGRESKPSAMLAELLFDLEEAVDQFLQRGFLSLREEFDRLDVLKDQHVSWYEREREFRGVALGVDARGALRARSEDGESLTLDAAEVHLREDPR